MEHTAAAEVVVDRLGCGSVGRQLRDAGGAIHLLGEAEEPLVGILRVVVAPEIDGEILLLAAAIHHIIVLTDSGFGGEGTVGDAVAVDSAHSVVRHENKFIGIDGAVGGLLIAGSHIEPAARGREFGRGRIDKSLVIGLAHHLVAVGICARRHEGPELIIVVGTVGAHRRSRPEHAGVLASCREILDAAAGAHAVDAIVARHEAIPVARRGLLEGLGCERKTRGQHHGDEDRDIYFFHNNRDIYIFHNDNVLEAPPPGARVVLIKRRGAAKSFGANHGGFGIPSEVP